jgi:cell division protein FtsB
MAQPIFDDETGSLLSLIKPLIEYAKEITQLKTDNAKLREEVASLNQRIEELELSPGPGPRYVAAAEHFNSLANN